MQKNDRAVKIAGITMLAVVIAFIFLFMLYCNYHTTMLVDDYAYCFDFSTGWDSPNPEGIYPPPASDRITDLASIFDSMASHRHCLSGRVLSHFWVQLFLLLPKDIFNFSNSLVFVLQIVFICLCSMAVSGRKSSWQTVCAAGFAFMSIFMCQPVFGEINLWTDGSCNYLWASSLTVLYVLFYLRMLKNGVFASSAPVNILVVLLGFPVGLSHEVSGVTMLVLSVTSILYLHFAKRKHNVWSFLSLASTLGGFLYLLLAPTELSVQMGGSSFQDLIARSFDNLICLLQLAAPLVPLMVLAVVLFAIAYYTKADKDLINISMILFFVTAASFGSLIFASYIAPRCLFITSVLLTLICTVLIGGLSGKDRKRSSAFILGVEAVMLIITPFFMYRCIRDVDATYDAAMRNIGYIVNCKEEGIEDIKLPEINRDGLSEYSPVKYLKYLDAYNSNSWPNRYMAKYYEVRSISFSGEVIDPLS